MSDSDPADDEPVPRLPRGRGMKLDRGMLFRIGATLFLLVMVVLTARPCANATSKFVTDFDEPKGSASNTMPKPGNVDTLGPEYEVIGPNMTDAERKAAIERAMAKARAEHGSAGSGSAGSGTGTGSGSAGSGSAAGSDSATGTAGTGSAAGIASGSNGR